MSTRRDTRKYLPINPHKFSIVFVGKNILNSFYQIYVQAVTFEKLFKINEKKNVYKFKRI